MRNARKVLLLAVMAVAALALGASTASAQTIEVSEEGGGHCGTVTNVAHVVAGGCLLHARSEGEVELRKHVFGIESHITSCENEFYGRVDTAGEGWIFEQSFPGTGVPHANCNREPCEEASGVREPWRAHADEGAPSTEGQPPRPEGREAMAVNFCISPLNMSSKETCEIGIPFQTYENQHRGEFGHATEVASHGVSGFRCEIIGHWNTETGGVNHGTEQEVVVVHFGA